MASLSVLLNTAFTPAAGDFIVSCAGGTVQLLRSNDGTAAFCSLAMIHNEGKTVSNPVAGAQYKFVTVNPNETPAVAANQ